MSLATIAPVPVPDTAKVLEFLGQTARFMQDPEVQKAFIATVGACGIAVAAVATFGGVCAEAWCRAGAGS